MQSTTGAVGSSVTAREEIGRAVAAKIRDLKSAKELSKVVEDVLPSVEKFLEAPAERQLRRLRTGLILQAIGIGSAIFIYLMSMSSNDPDLVGKWGAGIVVFLIGLAIFLNGRYLTVPRSTRSDDEERARLRDALDLPRLDASRMERGADVYLAPPPSVIENTTRELHDVTAQPRSRSTAE